MTRAAPSDLESAMQVAVRYYAAGSMPCWYCGGAANRCGMRVTEHMTPLSRGGADSPSNTCIACQSCNTTKRDMTVNEWRAARWPPGHQFAGEHPAWVAYYDALWGAGSWAARWGHVTPRVAAA